MNERLISRLRKIEALARSGIEGERANAQQMLDELCARHGVTLEELAEEDKKLRFFSARDGLEKTLLVQVVVFVCQTKHIRNAPDARKRGHWFELSVAQAIDVSECFAHYKRAWKEQLGDILLAFIAKNQIFGPRENDQGEIDDSAIERARRIAELMWGLRSNRWQRSPRLLEGREVSA